MSRQPLERHCLGRYYRGELRIALGSLGFASGFFSTTIIYKGGGGSRYSAPCMQCKEVKGRVCKYGKADCLDVLL